MFIDNWIQARNDKKGVAFKASMHKSYPNMLGPTEVYNNLWVGSFYDVAQPNAYKDFDFFINVCRVETAICDRWFPLNDNNGNTYKQFRKVMISLTINHRLENKILLNCVSGINRSVSVAATYIALTDKISFDEALSRIKAVRPFVSPRPELVALANKFIINYRDSLIYSDD